MKRLICFTAALVIMVAFTACGPAGVQGEKGTEGKSVYEIWLDEGYTGTEEDFLNWLKGASGNDGAEGRSAYEIWLDEGYTGTEADFLDWLKGVPGKDGEKGLSAYEIYKKYHPLYEGSEAQWIDDLVSGDLARWEAEVSNYVFEAEHTDLDDIFGVSIAGIAYGTDMILKEDDYHGAYPPVEASGGFYVDFLYSQGTTLTFDFTSDCAAKAVLWVRMSAKYMTMDFSDDEYLIRINGKKISYDPISIYIDPTSDYYLLKQPIFSLYGPILPFQDYLGIEVPIKQGLNRIELITNNNKLVFGTATATAPLVDCIKLDTTAILTWEPKYSNIF